MALISMHLMAFSSDRKKANGGYDSGGKK